MSNHQPQPHDPTPQRDRRIMRSTRAQQGQETRDGVEEGGGEAMKCKKPQKQYKSCRRDVENRRELGGRKKNVVKKVLVQ